MYIYISCALHHFRRLPPPLLVGCSGYVICISWSDANGSAFLSSSSVVLLVSCNIYWPYMKLAQINIKNWKVVYAVENVLVIQWWRQNFDPLILTFSYSHSPSHPPLHTLPFTPSHTYSPYTLFSTHLCSPSFPSCSREVSPSLIPGAVAAACPSNGHETTGQRESGPSQTPVCNQRWTHTLITHDARCLCAW